MFSSDTVEEIIDHIKNIVDSSRCEICDKIDGTRMRYVCGHTSCEDCAVASVDCYLCLTPQTTFQEPVIDKPLTERVKNVVKLLNVFQDEFHIDVYKRKRLSEQLKKEKEVFPECIQAPVKYYNKRKSSVNSKHNKENRLSQLPGEEVSSTWDKMDQTTVEQWLDKYVRKPFTDLNSNANKLRTNSKTNSHHVAIDSENIPISRKRTHNKTASNENQFTIKSKVKRNKKPKHQDVKTTLVNVNKNHITNKENDESGIGLDESHEAVIVIDDSQSVTTDKDLAALQAVIDAEKNKHTESVITQSKEPITQVNLQNINAKTDIYKVPFYLKSSLATFDIESKNSDDVEDSRDVSITIDNKSFITTIQVKRVDDTKKESPTQSVEVQTEIISEKNIEIVKEMTPVVSMLQNDNNVANAKDILKTDYPVKRKHILIIEESDSDEDIGASISMSVTAEIHKSCEEMDYNILGAIDNLNEHSKRARRAARGHTPASTDSSEKENFNPNRTRKTSNKKKKSTKK